jgi:hypothetical protein
MASLCLSYSSSHLSGYYAANVAIASAFLLIGGSFKTHPKLRTIVEPRMCCVEEFYNKSAEKEKKSLPLESHKALDPVVADQVQLVDMNNNAMNNNAENVHNNTGGVDNHNNKPPQPSLSAHLFTEQGSETRAEPLLHKSISEQTSVRASMTANQRNINNVNIDSNARVLQKVKECHEEENHHHDGGKLEVDANEQPARSMPRVMMAMWSISLMIFTVFVGTFACFPGENGSKMHYMVLCSKTSGEFKKMNAKISVEEGRKDGTKIRSTSDSLQIHFISWTS